jgi:hypothetical protein
LRRPDGWEFIGNRALSAQDKKAPRGPLHIMGFDGQLEAANHYYGLAVASFRDVEDFLVRRGRRN